MNDIMARCCGIVALIFLSIGAATPAGAQTRPTTDFPGDARLGACTHFSQGWDAAKLLPLIEQSGLGWVRDDLNWSSVEKAKGVYAIDDFTRTWIRAVHAHHVRLLLILNGDNPLYADRYDAKAYARWAAWVANELKTEVDAVEILNEPNNFGFSAYYGGQHDGEGDSPWLAKYVLLMNAAGDAIKAANPSMPVIGFGAGAAPTYKELDLGTSKAVDALADHPYSNHQPPEWVPVSAEDQRRKFGFATTDDAGTFASLIDGFRARSRQHAGPGQIWLTEWGYSTFIPTSANQFGGFTEAAQARYILRRFTQCMGMGVNASFLYDFCDDGDDAHNPEHRWGLVAHDGKPRESYWAVANLSAAFRGLRPAGDKEGGEITAFARTCWPEQAPIMVYRFVDKDNRPAAAIWASDRAGGDLQPRTADVELNWGNAVESIDLLSGVRKPLLLKQKGQRWIAEAMTVLDYPVLLKSAASGAPAAAIAQSPLRLFEKGRVWSFGTGQEFPGAAGSFRLDSVDDKPAGMFQYDFSKGGAYISADAELQIAPDIIELRGLVRAEHAGRLSVRLIDATDQCHQYALSCSGGAAWEKLRVSLEEPATEHWGGANDARIHFPIHVISLCVDKPEKNLTGTVAFAEFTAIPR